LEEPEKSSKHRVAANMGVYISRIWGEETPKRIEPIFFLVKDIRDIITHAKFGDDRLRGSGVVAGQISAFLIDFAGRLYNTLTLPSERVITTKNCSLSIVLTATDQKPQKSLKRRYCPPSHRLNVNAMLSNTSMTF